MKHIGEDLLWVGRQYKSRQKLRDAVDYQVCCYENKHGYFTRGIGRQVIGGLDLSLSTLKIREFVDY